MIWVGYSNDETHNRSIGHRYHGDAYVGADEDDDDGGDDGDDDLRMK